jgi:hypothetical protein
MSDLDFYVHFAAHGDVLGLGVGSSPDEWAAKFGDGFTEGPLQWGQFGRQFGPIDLSFDEGEHGWRTNSITLSVHKGAGGADYPHPTPVRAEYGEFPAVVEFDPIADGLAAVGVPVYRVTHPLFEGVTNYWIEETSTTFTVVSDAEYARDSGLAIGNVHSVKIARGDSNPADRRVRYR